MNLKDLIGEDRWKQLQKKHPDMEELSYVVVCETCGKIFFDESLMKVQEMLLSGEWDPIHPAYHLWYIQSARHWVLQKFHAVRVYVKAKDGDKTLVKDLSWEWTLGAKAKKISDKELLHALDRYEQINQSMKGK